MQTLVSMKTWNHNHMDARGRERPPKYEPICRAGGENPVETVHGKQTCVNISWSQQAFNPSTELAAKMLLDSIWLDTMVWTRPTWVRYGPRLSPPHNDTARFWLCLLQDHGKVLPYSNVIYVVLLQLWPWRQGPFWRLSRLPLKRWCLPQGSRTALGSG